MEQYISNVLYYRLIYLLFSINPFNIVSESVFSTPNFFYRLKAGAGDLGRILLKNILKSYRRKTAANDRKAVLILKVSLFFVALRFRI